MEWELKMPSWDLTELGRDGEPSLGSLMSSSSSLGRLATSPLDCSVDLKLGGSGNFELFHSWKNRPERSTATTVSSLSSSVMAVSSSASSKRARTLSSGTQNASCLVDGCTSDLSNCREYHRRHKVCEVHSKTPVVMVKGQEQRFCQQCSRFHLLAEFDEVKRSCRKRLDGHNRRRRKPQPADAINTGRFFADRPGSSRFSSFSPIFPSGAAAPEPNWAVAAAAAAAAMKAEEDATLYGHGLPFLQKQDHHPLGSFSRGYYHHQQKEGRQFPFLEEGGYGGRAAVVAEIHPLLGAIATSESSDSKIFSSGGFAVHGPDSDCALSLLSSPTQNSGINDSGGATAAAAEDRIPMGQPLLAVAGSLHQYGLTLFSRSSQASSHVVSPTGFSCAAAGMDQVGGTAAVLVADAGDAGLHGQGFFHLGVDGDSNRVSQPLPFSWQ